MIVCSIVFGRSLNTSGTAYFLVCKPCRKDALIFLTLECSCSACWSLNSLIAVACVQTWYVNAVILVFEFWRAVRVIRNILPSFVRRHRSPCCVEMLKREIRQAGKWFVLCQKVMRKKIVFLHISVSLRLSHMVRTMVGGILRGRCSNHKRLYWLTAQRDHCETSEYNEHSFRSKAICLMAHDTWKDNRSFLNQSMYEVPNNCFRLCLLLYCKERQLFTVHACEGRKSRSNSRKWLPWTAFLRQVLVSILINIPMPIYARQMHTISPRNSLPQIFVRL